MNPPPWQPTASSVQYAGTRNPATTWDFNRRVQNQGAVDLTTTASLSGKRKRQDNPKFSVLGGKRTKMKTIQTTNLATRAITSHTRWSQGAFRWVHKGIYVVNPLIPGDDGGGVQKGQHCVVKEFKTGSVYEESFFTKDILAVEKADEFVQAFNSIRLGPVGVASGSKVIYMNKPNVWQDIYPDESGRHKKKLVEPMLEGEFLKFNSNSGYSDGSEYMQALSHFSYHHSNGQYLFCDVQGGHYDDCYILTDPVIMSHDNSKQFGAGDLGSEGIDNFFHHHRCNRFCQGKWKKPVRPRASARIPCAPGTSLSLTLGTVKSEIDRKKELASILAKK